MSKLYVLGVFLALQFAVVAQLNIRGKVLAENTNQAISGVKIFVSNLERVTQSDANGAFEFADVSKGTYVLSFQKEGFKNQILQLDMDVDTAMTIILKTNVLEFQEFIVTGVVRATDFRMSPLSIKSLNLSELDGKGATNLIDAISRTPGVNQISTGSGISKPVIRGLGYNRVLVLNNGMRQEGQQWGDEHGVEIDEYSIERVEIIKGPGSLMYGSDAIAGVINFLPSLSMKKNGVQGNFTTNYQSNANLIAQSIRLSGHKDDFQWRVQGSSKLAGNYKNSKDGKVLNSGFNEINGNVYLGLDKKWGFTHLSLSSYNASFNMVEGERDSSGAFVHEVLDGSGGTNLMAATNKELNSYGLAWPHQNVAHQRIASNNFFRLKKQVIYLDLSFQNNKRKEYGSILNPDEIDLFFNLNTFNWNSRINFNPHKGWEFSLGLSQMIQSNENKGIEFLIPAYVSHDLGSFIYFQNNKSKQWKLAGGLRIDRRSVNSFALNLDSNGVVVSFIDSTVVTKFLANKYSFIGFSGSLGLVYLINENQQLKVNFSRGFRAPSLAELSSNGRHEGSLRYEYGNSNLKAEISHQLDLSYGVSKDHISIELTPFSNLISNYIFASKLLNSQGLDSIVDLNDPSIAYQFMQSKALLYGGELTIDVHPHPWDWLHIENSFSMVNAQQLGESKAYLPTIPAAQYQGELRFSVFQKVDRFKQSNISVATVHTLAQLRYLSSSNTETATPAYTLINLAATTTFQAKQKSQQIKFSLSIDNLTNVAYQSHLSRLKYAEVNQKTGDIGVFNRGRNVSIKVIFSF